MKNYPFLAQTLLKRGLRLGREKAKALLEYNPSAALPVPGRAGTALSCEQLAVGLMMK